MLIFFLFGTFVVPSKILTVLLPSIFIALFITFVARPLAVATVLAPFKTKISQYLVVCRGQVSEVRSVNRVPNNGYGRRCDNGAGHFPYCILRCIVFNYAARSRSPVCRK